VVALAEMTRVAFPLLYDVRETSGATTAVVWALVTFVAGPLLAPSIARLVGPARAIRLALAVAAAARIAIQVRHPIALWTVALGVVAGLIGLAVLVHEARARADGGGAAVAFLAGLAADQAIRGAFSTWDAAWQTGVAATAAGIGLPVLLLAVTVAARIESPPRGPTPRGVLGLAVLGPFLLLHLLFLGNAPFVGSELGWSLPASVAWVLLAAALSVGAGRWAATASPAGGVRAGLAVAFVAGIAAVALGGPALVLTGVPVSSSAAGALLALALGTQPGDARGSVGIARTAAALALGLVVFVGFAFAYQIDVNVPLPVPRATFPLVAAALVALAARRGRLASADDARWPVLVPVAGLAVVPLALLMTGGAPPPEPGDGTVTVVDWNIHTAVNGDGQVDLAAVADLLRSHDPDVIVLQEVGRGWPIAGATDEAEWLSRRLDMPYAWAKAGDDQFGNVVLSRFPIDGAEVFGLPYAGGPQYRSAIRVLVEVAPGRDLPVIGVHLEGGEGHSRTRTSQIEALLAHWTDETAVLAGDLNMQPTERDNVAWFEQAGYLSLQDTIGDPSASSARDPYFAGDRVDWIWRRGAVLGVRLEIVASDASDHLPLFAILDLGPAPD
jgi:endonuclease/exonuclease/phosphatase family metal-dependent hydrolase